MIHDAGNARNVLKFARFMRPQAKTGMSPWTGMNFSMLTHVTIKPQNSKLSGVGILKFAEYASLFARGLKNILVGEIVYSNVLFGIDDI